MAPSRGHKENDFQNMYVKQNRLTSHFSHCFNKDGSKSFKTARKNSDTFSEKRKKTSLSVLETMMSHHQLYTGCTGIRSATKDFSNYFEVWLGCNTQGWTP